MKRSVILTALSFLVLAQLGLAQVPQTINHQGVLRDASGDIVDNGDYTLTFKLWSAAEGGTELWSEAQSVPVIDGIFSAVLGVSETFSSTLADFESPLWLEMWIEAGPGVTGPEFLSPRIELTAVPYAIKSRGVAGSTNVFPGSGNVGIGTAKPEANLQVVGNWTLGPSGTPPSGFDSWLSGGSGILYEGGGADFAHHFSAYGAGDIARFGISTGVGVAPDTRVVITNSGDVGIGTGATAPSAKLEVVGTVKADSLILPTTTRYYSISPAAFNPPNNSTGFFRSADSIYSAMATGPAVFYAPANLPHGAVIKEMVAAFSDRVDPQNIVFDLRRMSLNSTVSDMIARCVSIGSSTAIQTVTESATTTVATVDNSSYTYVIHTYWPAPTIATDITVRSVKIVYEVTSPLP